MDKYSSEWKGNQTHVPDSGKCDNRLSPLHSSMEGEGQIFRRENGAAVAFSEYGDPHGAPVFFLPRLAELAHNGGADR
jgi:hypothetical protein